MIRSPALERVLAELGSAAKIRALEERQGHSIRDGILERGLEFGRLRWVLEVSTMRAADEDDVWFKDTDARITVHPDLCNGRPTIRGLRITVETIIGFLSAGDSPDEILRRYPSLESADVDACIAFAVDLQARRGVLVGLSDKSTKQCDIADLLGKVQIDPDYDYESLRQAAGVPPR